MSNVPDWEPGTNGAEANEYHRSVGGLRSQELRKQLPTNYADYKDVPRSTQRKQENRVKGAIQHASPEVQRAGVRWYQGAHVDAAHLAEKIPYHIDRPMDRATSAIARLSPSGGGMNWAKNVPAAHEANSLSDSDMDKVSKNQRGVLKGMNLTHASNSDIGKAHAVLHGHAEPESILTTQKIGHFYSNIRHPSGDVPQATRFRHPEFWNKVDSKGATVDGRADSILKGEHVPWGSPIGLSTQGRYDYESARYKKVGQDLGIPHHAPQAISWTVGEQAKQRRKPGEHLDYTDYDKSKPVLHSPGQFGKARMAQGMVPPSVVRPEGGNIQRGHRKTK